MIRGGEGRGVQQVDGKNSRMWRMPHTNGSPAFNSTESLRFDECEEFFSPFFSFLFFLVFRAAGYLLAELGRALKVLYIFNTKYCGSLDAMFFLLFSYQTCNSNRY